MSTLLEPFDYEEIFHKIIIVHLNTDTYKINVTKHCTNYNNYSV